MAATKQPPDNSSPPGKRIPVRSDIPNTAHLSAYMSRGLIKDSAPRIIVSLRDSRTNLISSAQRGSPCRNHSTSASVPFPTPALHSLDATTDDRTHPLSQRSHITIPGYSCQPLFCEIPQILLFLYVFLVVRHEKAGLSCTFPDRPGLPLYEITG